MIRLVHATIVGLVGAALVHLSVIFLLPLLSASTAWNQIAARTAENAPASLQESIDTDPARTGGNGPDPFFETAVCRYDLRDGALRVRASGDAPLWTVGVHDSLGTVVFSANDRIVAGRRLDLAVVDANQLRFVRQNAPAELTDAFIAPAGRPTGFVLVRAFRPDASWSAVIDRFIDGLACETLQF